MPYTEQGYIPKQRNPKRQQQTQKGPQKQHGQKKPQQQKQTQKPNGEMKGVKRTQGGNQTPAKYKQNNPFGAKVTDELKQQHLEKKQRKESNEDAVNQMKYIIDSHFKAHKKWTAGDVEQLITLSNGSMFELSIKPDASRIIQTIIKQGDNDQKQTVITELQPKFYDLTRDQYGHHVIKKLIKHQSKTVVSKLVETYKGHIFEMLTHTYSCKVLKELCEHLNKTQQRRIVEEVYGAQYQFLKNKDPSLKTFKDVINSNETMRNVICKDLKDKIQKILNKPKIVINPLINHLLMDYIQSVEEKDASEVAASLREQLQLFIKTPEGPKLMRFVIINSSAKARKGLMKEFNEHVYDYAKDTFGHYCILYLLRHVDDKLALKKYILDQITTNIQSLLFEKCGVEVIEFILDPLNTHFLPPSVIDPLREKGQFTVKDDDIRFKDMLDEIKPSLLQAVQREYKTLLKYKSTRRLLSQVKKVYPDDTSFIIEEDLKGKKIEEENAEEKKEENEVVEKKEVKEVKEKKEEVVAESDAVMEGDEIEDIEEIKKEVAEDKKKKLMEMKKLKMMKKKKSYK